MICHQIKGNIIYDGVHQGGVPWIPNAYKSNKYIIEQFLSFLKINKLLGYGSCFLIVYLPQVFDPGSNFINLRVKI